MQLSGVVYIDESNVSGGIALETSSPQGRAHVPALADNTVSDDYQVARSRPTLAQLDHSSGVTGSSQGKENKL